jgi:PAS domain S-box-containing protein
MIYLVIFMYQNIQRNKESFQWVTHTHEVIEDIRTVHSSVMEIESQLRGYVISGNPVFIKNYSNKKEILCKNISRLQEHTVDNAQQQKNCAVILQLTHRKIAFQLEVMDRFAASPDKAKELIAGLEGKRITDSIDNLLQIMQKHEQGLLSMRLKHFDHFTELRYTTTLVIAVVAFFVLAILMMKIGAEARLRRLAEQKALLSEQKYKGLIENSALVVHATDLDGNFTYLSGKCKDFTGFTAEELAGENYLTIVEESWRQKVQAFYQKQKENHTPETLLEFPIVSKTGELRWLEQSVVLVLKDGEPTGFQSIAKDITEKKYAEKLLADAEQRIKAKQEEYQERLQSILDNMPMIIYLKDMDGRFIMVNRQFHQTFDTTDEQIIGKTSVSVHKYEAGSKRFEAADEQVKKTGKPVELEETLLTAEGERNMLIVKFPLYDKNNELFAISAVGKDITEIIRYQRQLISARKRAEKAERLQEEFLANMSHEIRTPMNGIIGMTNLMETTSLNAEQQDYLHLIKESSGILLNLINDILDLSKIKSGRMLVEQADFDLHQTIESILAPFRIKAKEKNIGLNKILQDVPPLMNGDQHKLQQVLNNLLSNAVKFTAHGAVTLFATTEMREDGSLYFICSVSDTGIGIAPENLEQVFESFVQAGNDMVRRFGGTGLGLAITKRLIELMGGKITVSSALGEGTSFYFELPLVLGKSTGALMATETVQPKEHTTSALQGKKILLVEDNLVNQKVTYLMLHKAGLLVDIANHGKEAVALLNENAYDLIITDLQMPEMDGFQTAAYIRSKLHLTTPIIAMTASALRNEKDRCLELGMNEYLTKPFAPASLFFHLKRLLTSEENAGEAPVAEAKEKPAALYNLSYLEEMEDNEYVAEVLELFLSLTPQTLGEIKESTFQEQWSEVYKKAHSLKSSLGILQMNTLLHTVTEIETKAKTQKETDIIENLLHHATQQYKLIKPMLEAELETTRKKIVL